MINLPSNSGLVDVKIGVPFLLLTLLLNATAITCTEVVHLNLDNFEEYIQASQQCVVVLVYAGWNGHARSFLASNKLTELAHFFPPPSHITIAQLELNDPPPPSLAKYLQSNYWMQFVAFPPDEKSGILIDRNSGTLRDLVKQHCGRQNDEL